MFSYLNFLLVLSFITFPLHSTFSIFIFDEYITLVVLYNYHFSILQHITYFFLNYSIRIFDGV